MRLRNGVSRKRGRNFKMRLLDSLATIELIHGRLCPGVLQLGPQAEKIKVLLGSVLMHASFFG